MQEDILHRPYWGRGFKGQRRATAYSAWPNGTHTHLVMVSERLDDRLRELLFSDKVESINMNEKCARFSNIIHI